MTLYMPIGPPGCGKTTLRNKMIGHGLIGEDAVVSPDEFRYRLTGHQSDQKCTAVAYNICNRITDYRLNLGLDVYADATNLVRKSRNDAISAALGYHQPVTLILSTILPDQCLARNANVVRTNAGVVVPEHAMKVMFERHAAVDLEEDWSDDHLVTITDMESFYENIS